jgi:hypothetical protein
MKTAIKDALKMIAGIIVFLIVYGLADWLGGIIPMWIGLGFMIAGIIGLWVVMFKIARGNR